MPGAFLHGNGIDSGGKCLHFLSPYDDANWVHSLQVWGNVPFILEKQFRRPHNPNFNFNDIKVTWEAKLRYWIEY